MSPIPYRSERQRRYMHAQHPGIAAKWDEEYGGKVVPKKKKVSKSMTLVLPTSQGWLVRLNVQER